MNVGRGEIRGGDDDRASIYNHKFVVHQITAASPASRVVNARNFGVIKHYQRITLIDFSGAELSVSILIDQLDGLAVTIAIAFWKFGDFIGANATNRARIAIF